MVKIITDWLLLTPLDELQYICNKIIGDVRIIEVRSKKRYWDYSVLIKSLSPDKIEELKKEPFIRWIEYVGIFLNIKLDYIFYITGNSYLLNKYLWHLRTKTET